jgi:hypothetical protein
MRTHTGIIIVLVVMVFSMLACSFPLQVAIENPQPTANYLATTVVAQATLLTSIAEEASAKQATEISVAQQAPTEQVAAVAASPSPVPITVPPTAAAVLPQRPGGAFTANKFTPVIDGVLDEWKTPENQCNYVVFGANYWRGSSDLGCSFRVAWDEQNVYFTANVTDDVYAQRSGGQDLYLGDSVEIQIDSNLSSDFYTNTINNDDYQLGISPGYISNSGAKEADLYFPDNIKGVRTQVIIASAKTPGGYIVEAAIPWAVYGITPSAGNRYGFALSISDNDSPSGNYQQSMISSTAGRKLLNPTTWSELVLSN